MKKIACLCSGQGSQFEGMGLSAGRLVQKALAEAGSIMGLDLLELARDGDLETISQTNYLQPILFCYSYGNFEEWQESYQLKPDLYAGHSLGEISALACARVIPFHEALELVIARGALMHRCSLLSEGGMAVIKNVGEGTIDKICRKHSDGDGFVSISGYNSKNQTSISGNNIKVKKVLNEIKGAEGRGKILQVEGPFHSIYMKEAIVEFQNAMRNLTVCDEGQIVISCTTGLPHQLNREDLISSLSMQLVKPVRWVSVMTYMARYGVEYAVEFGAKGVLTSFVNTDTRVKAFDYSDVNSRQRILETLVPSQNENRLQLMSNCLAAAICLNNFGTEESDYRKGVQEPYLSVKRVFEELVEKKEEPTVEQMKEAVGMLESVMRTKCTPVETGNNRIAQIIEKTGVGSYFENIGLD